MAAAHQNRDNPARLSSPRARDTKAITHALRTDKLQGAVCVAHLAVPGAPSKLIARVDQGSSVGQYRHHDFNGRSVADRSDQP